MRMTAKLSRRSSAVVLAGALALAGAACGDDAEDTVDNVEEDVEDAGDDGEESTEDTGDDTGESTEDTGDSE